MILSSDYIIIYKSFLWWLDPFSFMFGHSIIEYNTNISSVCFILQMYENEK